jgi:hypothetical protein
MTTPSPGRQFLDRSLESTVLEFLRRREESRGLLDAIEGFMRRHLGPVSLVLFLLAPWSCQSPGPVTSLEVQRSALTDSGPVFGFETLSGWTATTGTKSSSTDHTEGTSSLSLNGAVGYTELDSVAVNFTGTSSTTVAYDLKVVTTRPAPSWSGSTSLYLSCPSRNLSNTFVGPKSFNGLAAVEFRTVRSSLPSNVSSALANGCSDLGIRLAVNIPSGTAGSYIVDNFRFNPALPILSPSPSSVFGFENSNEWSISNQPTQPVSPSTLHTQGNNAIQFTANGYTVVRSPDLATIGPIGGTISYDIWIPTLPANTWPGQTALIINAPSIGINGQNLGTIDLTGKPMSQFSTVTFTIPSSVRNAISSGSYDDLSFSIVVNVNTSGTYRLDNLTLGTVQPTLSCIDLLDSTHATAHFGYVSGLTTTVTIPGGPSNTLLPSSTSTPPTSFAPGTPTDVFDVPFGPPQISWVLGAGTATAMMSSKTCFPPTTILKCTKGSQLPDCVSQIVTQVSSSTIGQRATIANDLVLLADMTGFAQTLSDDARGRVNPLARTDVILVELAMLGLMKTGPGTQLLKDVVHMPIPTSGTCVSMDRSSVCGGPQESLYLRQLQTSAIDGLGFLRTSDGDTELLAAVANGTNPSLQARAVSAYLWNHGDTQANRDTLRSMLSPDRRHLVDRIIKNAQMTLPVLGQALHDFYNLHPELQPPFPQ